MRSQFKGAISSFQGIRKEVLLIISILTSAIIIMRIANDWSNFYLMPVFIAIVENYQNLRDGLFNDIFRLDIVDIDEDILSLSIIFSLCFFRAWLVLTKELRQYAGFTIVSCLFELILPIVFMLHMMMLIIVFIFDVISTVFDGRHPMAVAIRSFFQLLSKLGYFASHAPMVLLFPFQILKPFMGEKKDSYDADNIKSPVAQGIIDHRKSMGQSYTGPAFRAFAIFADNFTTLLFVQMIIFSAALFVAASAFATSYLVKLYL